MVNRSRKAMIADGYYRFLRGDSVILVLLS